MDKKEYIIPECEVVELDNEEVILATSDEEEETPDIIHGIYH